MEPLDFVQAGPAAVIMSILLSLVNRPGWSAERKQALSWVAAIVTAVAYAAYFKDLTPANVGTLIPTIWGYSQVYYTYIQKRVGLEAGLRATHDSVAGAVGKMVNGVAPVAVWTAGPLAVTPSVTPADQYVAYVREVSALVTGPFHRGEITGAVAKAIMVELDKKVPEGFTPLSKLQPPDFFDIPVAPPGG